MVGQAAIEPLLAPCRELDSAFDYFNTVPQYESPLWQLVTARPRHLLDPRYAGWDQLLQAAADQVVEVMSRNGRRLAERSWGERNAGPSTRASCRNGLGRSSESADDDGLQHATTDPVSWGLSCRHPPESRGATVLASRP